MSSLYAIFFFGLVLHCPTHSYTKLKQEMSIADVLGTIDYTYEDDVVLRICESVEKQKCVLQIVSFLA